MNLDLGLSGSSSAVSGVNFNSPMNITGGGGSQSIATAPKATATATSSPKLWLLLLIPGGILLFAFAFWLLARKKKRR